MDAQPTTIAAHLGAPPFAGAALTGNAATRSTLRTFVIRAGAGKKFAMSASMDALTGAYADPRALAEIIGTDADTARAKGLAAANARYAPRTNRPMPGPLGAAAARRDAIDRDDDTRDDVPSDDDALFLNEPAADDAARKIKEALDIIAGATRSPLDEGRVIELIQKHAPKAEPRGLMITISQAPAVAIDNAHAMLPTVLTWIASGAYPALIGPAGTGKTELVMQAAKALGRAFTMSGAVDSQYKLSGFMDAHGRYVATPFRDAYQTGKVFLLDDTDRSNPGALNWLNAALANGCCDFPDGMVQRHPDFVCCLSANTYGRGNDRQYVGANQIDAATLDRFQFLEIDYDETLERALCGNEAWARRVQAIRAAARSVQARLVVSMRASIRGAAGLAAGIPQADVEAACIWKGIDAATRSKIEGAL